MGAWGPAIFSDDTASDVRDCYREHVGDGLEGPAATDRMLAEWQRSLGDPDERPVFWLALAATQWNCGRLEDRVLREAIAVIRDGSDLQRWTGDPKLLKQRSAALKQLETQLLSPQPKAVRLKKRFRSTCDWVPGEIIGYQLKSGRWALFWVQELRTDRGGTRPVCVLLDWEGLEIPSAAAVATLEVRGAAPTAVLARPGDKIWFSIGRTSERELPQQRLHRLGLSRQPNLQKPWGVAVYLWRRLDAALESDFGIS